MSRRISRIALAVSAGSLLAGAPVLAACGPSDRGPSYSQWAATDGAAGRINLDDVQEASMESSSATEFEDRVNEIYEGDGLILIRARQEGDRLTLEGWEDLDANNRIDDAGDDQLFAIVKEDEQHELRGYHANSYYHSHFGAGDFLFTYLLISSLNRGPYYYQTVPDRATDIRRDRSSYRGSSRYDAQLERNRQYTSRQQTFAGSRYPDAERNVSSGRQTYQQTQRSSGAFRSSSALTSGSSSISRSSAIGGGGSTISRSSGLGGFSGGGSRVRFLDGPEGDPMPRPAWLA
jgi:hypothetical protein